MRTEFLKSQTLFDGIPESGLDEIAPLLREDRFPEGQEILREGELGDRLYLLCEGSVEVMKNVSAPEGEVQVRISRLRTGGVFGEMELIDVQARSASVRAIEPTRTLSLSNMDLLRLSETDFHTFTFLIMNLARELSLRLREIDARAADLIHRTGGKREKGSGPRGAGKEPVPGS